MANDTIVLATLAHDFLVFDIRTASWGRLFVAGAAEARAGIPSGAALGPFAVTWLVGCLITLDTVTSSSLSINRVSTLRWAVPSMSLALAISCWVLRGCELTDIARMVPTDVASMLALGERITRLSEHYAIVALGMAVAMAVALSSSDTPREPGAPSRRYATHHRCTLWEIGKFSVVVAVALWLIHGVGLRPIQADTLYNVGRQLHADHRQLTIALYQQAAAVAVYEDQYAFEVQGLQSR